MELQVSASNLGASSVGGIVMIEGTKPRTWAVVKLEKMQGQELKYCTQIFSPVGNPCRPAGAHIEGRTNFSTIK